MRKLLSCRKILLVRSHRVSSAAASGLCVGPYYLEKQNPFLLDHPNAIQEELQETMMLCYLLYAVLVQSAIGQLLPDQSILVRSKQGKPTKCTVEIPLDIIHSREALDLHEMRLALKEVEELLHRIYDGASSNAVSVAIVHASYPGPILKFNEGRLRLNESSPEKVTSDSVFRVNSLSKVITALSVLTMQQEARRRPKLIAFGMASRLIDALPGFELPQRQWQEGAEITLEMLMSHTSGLPREGFSFEFDLVKSTPKASTAYIGNKWASTTPSSVLAFIKTKGLVWAPGQRPGYSNAGYALLGHAVARQASLYRGGNKSWSEIVTESILEPLNMTRSFFGHIPAHLKSSLSIPGTSNWVDLVLGPGYDPAAGMWSSAEDLTRFTHAILLQRTPELIDRIQRKQWLTHRLWLGDGKQSVGPGWEIDMPDTAQGPFASDQPFREQVFGKAGDGGGHHSHLSLVPALGYGVVVLTADGNSAAEAPPVSPHQMAMQLHQILAPNFRAAYTYTLGRQYEGRYVPESSLKATPQTEDEAILKLEPESNALRLERLVWHNSSVLGLVDALSYVKNDQGQKSLSQPEAKTLLHPSEIEAHGTVGQLQTWHLSSLFEDRCNWFDFDAYSDVQGNGLDRLLLGHDQDGTPVLEYSPLNLVYRRIEP